MDVLIKQRPLKGEIGAITSKSSMHRLLIAAALANNKTEILYTDTNEDIKATILVLSALGATIEEKDGSVIVAPIMEPTNNPVLNCNQSASTARFIIPVAAALTDSFTITGDKQLSKRPFAPLINELREHGIHCSSDSLPIEVLGKIKSGKYSLPGNISSQYISGLIFALPLLSGDSEIKITTNLESIPYIDMTIDAISKFGITINMTESGYMIKGGQEYVSPQKIVSDTDWSNGAFWLVAAAVGNEITVTDLKESSLQGDKKIVDILDKFGAIAIANNGRYSFSSSISDPQAIDAKNIPDLVPILSVAASKAVGITRIFNIERLRIKESDRVKSVINMINALGGSAYEQDNSIIIEGSGSLKGGVVDASGDHRIAMAAAVAACISAGEVMIKGAEAVNKSYPKFFEDYKQLGGEINVK